MPFAMLIRCCYFVRGRLSLQIVTQLSHLVELQAIENSFRELPVFTPSSYKAPVVGTGLVGRPSYYISREQLMLLQSYFFSWTAISSIIGVSRWTVCRRVNALEITETFVSYTQISDTDL